MQIRPASAAGTFYYADPEHIRRQLTPWMDQPADPQEPPRAMIVPHAGYVYSGHTAANAYRHLFGHKNQYQKVIVVGPSHYFRFDGIAVPDVQQFSTPLGKVPLNQPAIDQLLLQNQVITSDNIHAPEHSLEVQLPFLQLCLDKCSLIPILTGRISAQELANIIDPIWTNDTLLIISSDLSHFNCLDGAIKIDQATCKLIEQSSASLTQQQACGSIGINALLLLIRQKQLTLKRIEYSNSASFSGDKNRVVGYVSYLIS
mgnify:CR=1 FL=1